MLTFYEPVSFGERMARVERQYQFLPTKKSTNKCETDRPKNFIIFAPYLLFYFICYSVFIFYRKDFLDSVTYSHDNRRKNAFNSTSCEKILLALL